MKKFQGIISLVLLLGTLACVIPLSEYEKNHYVLKPQGERIKVTAKNGGTLVGEFLFVDEESVYVLEEIQRGSPPKIVIEPFERIQSIKILGITNGKWLGFVLGFQIAPAILLGATFAANSDNSDWVKLVGVASIPGVVTSLLFWLTTPGAPTLEGKIDLDKMRDFLKYARYPFIPNPELKQQILEGLKRPSLKIAVKLP